MEPRRVRQAEYGCVSISPHCLGERLLLIHWHRIEEEKPPLRGEDFFCSTLRRKTIDESKIKMFIEKDKIWGCILEGRTVIQLTMCGKYLKMTSKSINHQAFYKDSLNCDLSYTHSYCNFQHGRRYFCASSYVPIKHPCRIPSFNN